MWFKYGLKAQKLQKQHALKGQKLLAQGIALGNNGRKPVALKGRLADCYYAPGSPRYSKMVDTWRGGKYWLCSW